MSGDNLSAARQPARVSDLDDVKAWIAEHDGRIEAWWEEQRRTNERGDRRLTSHADRLSVVERRMMWLAGAASLGGSVAGAFLSSGIGG